MGRKKQARSRRSSKSRAERRADQEPKRRAAEKRKAAPKRSAANNKYAPAPSLDQLIFTREGGRCRHSRNPKGKGKVKYATELDAKLALARARGKGRDENRYYPCEHCHHYHLTSKRKRGGKSAEQRQERGTIAAVRDAAQRQQERNGKQAQPEGGLHGSG